MLDRLTTEARNPSSEKIDQLSPLEIVRLMNEEDAKIAAAVAAEAEKIAKAVEMIANCFQAGGRLIYMGAGTSGRLGVLDASECPPTFSTPPEMVVGLIAGGYGALTRAVEGAEDRLEQGEADLRALKFSPRDVLVGIATSGRTPYVIGGLRYARSLGAFAIGLSCNAESQLIRECDLAITPVVGPEIISGSTRLKAGTATKMVLNILTTGAMVRIGKTFGNLMVDLRATNTKLIERACRMVMHFTDATRDEAMELLSACNGELKTAVVVRSRHTTPENARKLLADAGGQLRIAMHKGSSE